MQLKDQYQIRGVLGNLVTHLIERQRCYSVFLIASIFNLFTSDGTYSGNPEPRFYDVLAFAKRTASRFTETLSLLKNETA
jgi:hypothetical protein